ncbi:MAG: hypothetical protein ACK5QS_12240 [Pseudanabaenaceae cyanobacterium]|jgi:hypothetical protein
MTTLPLTTAQTTCYAKVLDFLEQIHQVDNHHSDPHRESQFLKTKKPHRFSFTAVPPSISLVIAGDDNQLGASSDLHSELHIEIAPWLEDRSMIRLWAWLTETEVRHEKTLLYLLRKNEKFQFGGFSMAAHGGIRFQVSLLGETCQINEFVLALAEVINAIDNYLPEIQHQLGFTPEQV